MSSRRKTRRRAAVLSLAATSLSCTPAPPAEQAPTVSLPSAPGSAPPAPPSASAQRAVELLRAEAVLHARAARGTLYTWTTRDQIDELVKQRALLTRFESPERGATFFDQMMDARAASGDRVAALLRTMAFVRARHAWTAPWATLLGWPGEDYGDQLIRIDLKPEAWIAKLFQSRPGIDVVDLSDRPVPIEEVVAHPERLAAVYFAHDISDKGALTTYAGPRDRPAYREYVICNESMIDRWAIGTPEITRELTKGAAAVEALRAYLDETPHAFVVPRHFNERAAYHAWTGAEPLDTPELAFAAALAFPNENYLPVLRTVQALLTRLHALGPQAPPLEHRPSATFPRDDLRKPAPPLRIPQRRGGTY